MKVIAKSSEIIELIKKGYSYREIGHLFGVSKQRIHQILTKNGVYLLTDYEKVAKEYLEKQGYKIYKNCPLLPDFTCIKNSKFIFYEIKSGDGWKFGKKQKDFFEEMKKNNYKINLLRIRCPKNSLSLAWNNEFVFENNGRKYFIALDKF